MSYGLFLVIFLVAPIGMLLAAHWLSERRGRKLPAALTNIPPWLAIVVHMVVALVYTTPWDNYLVANGVWYYDPELVLGITFGWVPLEEYTFFILQPLLTGLWLLLLARYLPRGWTQPEPGEAGAGRNLRRITTVALGGLWVVMAGVLASGWQPGTYLGLILTWALPPIMLQTAFGADLLWRRGGLVLLGLGAPTLFLALADSLAITTGIWTIHPEQSVNLFLWGALPVEEFMFFLITNILITFGVTLALTCESRVRAREFFRLRQTWLSRGHEEQCIEQTS
jgi:lycopene cyclase domain-containing protein